MKASYIYAYGQILCMDEYIVGERATQKTATIRTKKHKKRLMPGVFPKYQPFCLITIMR